MGFMKENVLAQLLHRAWKAILSKWRRMNGIQWACSLHKYWAFA
jgi:hypothetical protein